MMGSSTLGFDCSMRRLHRCRRCLDRNGGHPEQSEGLCEILRYAQNDKSHASCYAKADTAVAYRLCQPSHCRHGSITRLNALEILRYAQNDKDTPIPFTRPFSAVHAGYRLAPVAAGLRILIFISRRGILPFSRTFIAFLISGTFRTTSVFPTILPLVQ
jgi:hypothetical protein